MQISSMFGSNKYLRAEDLQGRPHRLTIQQVIMESMDERDGRSVQKPIMYFVGAGKAMVLNITNANTITEMYGDETDNWNGKPVELFPDMTDFQGRRVACIRIRPPAGVTPASVGVQPVGAALPDPAGQAPIGQEFAPTVPVGDNSDVPF